MPKDTKVLMLRRQHSRK